MTDLELHRYRLTRAGLTEPFQVGDAVLPAILGPITRYNAEGKHKIRRDLPKETAYRQVEWHWKERHGPDTVERSDIKDVPYMRYPRDFISPPSEEIMVAQASDNSLLFVTRAIAFEEASREQILHAINVCLELFGECQVFTEDLNAATGPGLLRRLNWHLLPPGRYPWDRLQSELRPVIEKAKQGNRGLVTRRLETISEAGPDFTAVGTAGFSGYVVFGFPSRNLYVLESVQYGNATYVFEGNWERLSQLTKAEILGGSLHKDRIVHRDGWDERVGRILR